MKKYFFFLIALLSLAACDDSIQEHWSDPYHPYGYATLYIATPGFPGYPEMIYSIQGDTIYQCEEGAHIQSLLAEDKDWYALLKNDNGVYSSIKNGKLLREYSGTVFDFAVDGGSVYTLHEHENHMVWVCKDGQLLYDVPDYVQYNMFSVHDGNVAIPICDEQPGYWYNSNLVKIDGLDHGFKQVYGIDVNGNDILITYESKQQAGKYMYWWNGKNYELPETFIPTTSRLVNGHPVVIGRKITSQDAYGTHCVPVAIVDGIESVLSQEEDLAAVQLFACGSFTFILVKDVAGNDSNLCAVFQNLRPMYMEKNIKVPEELRKFYIHNFSDDGSTISLDELGITAIARVSIVPW